MGKIEGVRIKNFGPLKDIVMGKTLSNQKGMALGNLTAIIGPSGNGKSTLADAFGFLADCLEIGVEAACDTKNRGGFQQIRSQGVEEAIKFELYYRETSTTRPITYELEIDEDGMGRPYVKEERLRQRVEKRGWPLSFLFLQSGKGYAYEGKEGGADDNGDRKVTARELFNYANPKTIERFNIHPQMWGNFNDNMVVSIVP